MAWTISQVLYTHYITLYVSFILKYEKTRRPDNELVQGRQDFWIQRNFADWYQLTVWPNILTQEHFLYKQPSCSARKRHSFQTDALGCKPIRDHGKIKHNFTLFLSKKSSSWRIQVFSFSSFCATLDKIHFLTTSESVIRRKKKREKCIRSTYFQESSQKFLELASYGNDINHTKKYILDLPKINPVALQQVRMCIIYALAPCQLSTEIHSWVWHSVTKHSVIYSLLPGFLNSEQP